MASALRWIFSFFRTLNSLRTLFESFVRQTARDLAQRGAYLILGCRSRLKGLKAVKEIAMSTGNSRVEMMDLDLTSLASVREFAKAVIARAEPLQVVVVDCFFLLLRVQVLINNAGMMSEETLESSQDLRFTADGLEVVTQVGISWSLMVLMVLRWSARLDILVIDGLEVVSTVGYLGH